MLQGVYLGRNAGSWTVNPISAVLLILLAARYGGRVGLEWCIAMDMLVLTSMGVTAPCSAAGILSDSDGRAYRTVRPRRLISQLPAGDASHTRQEL
jgi:hypothetical protein